VRKHAIRTTATGTAGVVLVIALVFMVNWIGARHWVRSDWTSSHLYTLSEKTENILKNLGDDVRVVVFMTPASPLYEQVHELLARYASVTDRIQVEYIDPDKEPLKTRQLAEQFGISVANTVVFAVGDRTKYVTSDQMAEYDYGGLQMGQGPALKAFKGEEQFTSAILSLVAPTVPKVYFVTGHGEASLENLASSRSLRTLKESLKRENMETADTSLLGGSIPEDADALAILGPTTPFAENEIRLLDDWLAGGGRLLVCLDPLIARDGSMKTTRLESLLGEHGVEVHDDLVIDPSRRLPFFDLSAVYLTDFLPHPITKSLEGLAVLFPVARSLEALPGGNEFSSRALIQTSADGWGETNLGQLLRGSPVEKDDADTPGPVTVAVAVQESRPGAEGEEQEENADGPGKDGAGYRLVAVGDSDFLVDGQIENAGNLTLALNIFNWLAQQDESLGIPPREVEQVSLFLSRQQMRLVLLITLVFMPLAAILAGILVWRRRRH